MCSYARIENLLIRTRGEISIFRLLTTCRDYLVADYGAQLQREMQNRAPHLTFAHICIYMLREIYTMM